MPQATSKTSTFIEAPNLAVLLNTAYENKWVAFSHDYSKILASADTLPKLLEHLSDEEKAADPIFYKVPAKNSYRQDDTFEIVPNFNM